VDPQVRDALARWPDVPAAFGWLALDPRGNWLLRGSSIGNQALRRFIDRNYAADDTGRWFFQQRVYVDLARAPWICRLDLDHARLQTHTGLPIERVARAMVDEDCQVTLLTEHGAAAVDDRDGAQLLAALVDAHGAALDDAQIERWLAHRRNAWLLLPAGARRPVAIEAVAAHQVAAALGFQRHPQPSKAS
jgi:hypothetical protein